MAVFSSRSVAYKGGVVLLFFATFVFIVGFAVPFWQFTSESFWGAKSTRYFGLWMGCQSVSSDDNSNTDCETLNLKNIDDRLHAIRTLESLCLLGLLASCVLALVTNCCRTVPGPHTRALEIMASLSGLTGFVGCMVFVGSVKENRHFGFYLATIGSGLCVVAAFIIAMFNTPLEAEAQGALYTVPMTTTPQGQGQDQGQGQGQPAAGGALYGQPSGNAQPSGYYPQPSGNYPQPSGNYPQSYGNYPQSYGYPAA